MAKQNLRPAALATGIVVVGGIVLYSMRKKSRCQKLPDIWTEEGPLHMSREAQDDALELARYKIREYVLAGEIYKLSDVQMHVADELRDCAWEKLESDEQKQVWSGIGQIVNEVNQRAKQDPDGFLKGF